MDLKKREAYHGYEAYSYLERGVDYPAVEWAQWDWAGRHVVDLDPAEEERVARILADNPFVSLHEHPTFYPADMSSMNSIYDAMRDGRQACAYEALSYSNIDCVFDDMLDGFNIISGPGGWKWIDIVHDLGMRLCDIAHQDFLVHVRKVEDIYRAKREGKIAWVACVEGAAPIENEVDRIDILYGLGVRQLGLVYSESNALGNGLKEDNDGGLTKFGRACVKRMNQVGMLVDVSHCGPKTALDGVMASEKPIIVTHCGARKVWPSKRLANDDLIKAVAEKGGVFGIESAPHTTMSMTNKTHDLDSVMEHFEYVADLVGIDHVGFGIDSLYGDHVGMHHAFSEALSIKETNAQGVEYDEVPFVWGLENPTEASWNIPRWLVKHGYSDEDIAKVIGGNALRVLEQVWA